MSSRSQANLMFYFQLTPISDIGPGQGHPTPSQSKESFARGPAVLYQWHNGVVSSVTLNHQSVSHLKDHETASIMVNSGGAINATRGDVTINGPSETYGWSNLAFNDASIGKFPAICIGYGGGEPVLGSGISSTWAALLPSNLLAHDAKPQPKPLVGSLAIITALGALSDCRHYQQHNALLISGFKRPTSPGYARIWARPRPAGNYAPLNKGFIVKVFRYETNLNTPGSSGEDLENLGTCWPVFHK